MREKRKNRKQIEIKEERKEVKKKLRKNGGMAETKEGKINKQIKDGRTKEIQRERRKDRKTKKIEKGKEIESEINRERKKQKERRKERGQTSNVTAVCLSCPQLKSSDRFLRSVL